MRGSCEDSSIFDLSSPRKRGPIRRVAYFERRCSTAFAQPLTPVVMGPCFRRDDVGLSRLRIPAARYARGVPESFAQRGRGECRAPNAPAASRAKVESTRVSHHRSTGFIPAFPHAMVLTVSFVLSPVIGLSCHRHLARLLARLDAGFEASGPHDFAVRGVGALVLSAARVHRIPPRVDDVAQRPSVGQDGGSCRSDLPDGESEIFLRRGGWTGNP
jgi:hypothetical protein